MSKYFFKYNKRIHLPK